MKLIEYGKENPKVIMLLHGGGLSWWNYRDIADKLKNNYHVILPVLDGHADSGVPFTSIENNAKELINYIENNFQGSVLAIGGLSLGGQILIEMLTQKSDICKFALIESALVTPMPMTYSLIAPMLALCYKLIRKKWFSALQFKTLKIQKKYYADYYQDTCKIQQKDMISFLKANSSYTIKPKLAATTAAVAVVAGTKEQKKILISAKALHRTISKSKLYILKGYYHGEFSLNHPEYYSNFLKHMISS